MLKIVQIDCNECISKKLPGEFKNFLNRRNANL